jgi:hypothetical protein
MITIKKDDSLKKLCQLTGIRQGYLIERILSFLIENKIVYDEKASCPYMISEFSEESDFSLKDICMSSINNFSEEVQQTVGNLIIWGTSPDGPQCDKCGCPMNFLDGEYKYNSLCDDTPAQYIPVWEKYKCINCDNETIV